MTYLLMSLCFFCIFLFSKELQFQTCKVMDEVFDDPQVRHLSMAQTVQHPVRGDVNLVAQPVALSRTPASLRTAVPEAGEHTDEVLEQFGIDPARIAALRDAGTI